MPFNITQQDIVEVSKIIGVQLAMSVAALLLNDRFKISPVSAEAAVMIGLLSIPMGSRDGDFIHCIHRAEHF